MSLQILTAHASRAPVSICDEKSDLLNQAGFLVIDDWLSDIQLASLRAECRDNLSDFRTAQISSGLMPSLRSDRICWINSDHTQGQDFIGLLSALVNSLNRQFFTGIRWVEAHYAHYPTGSRYAQHQDNPKHSSDRVFSCVFYLHEHWEPGFGGLLRLQALNPLKNQSRKSSDSVVSVDILPISNRLVIFDSNLVHEVTTSGFERFSIAAWLRRDEPKLLSVAQPLITS